MLYALILIFLIFLGYKLFSKKKIKFSTENNLNNKKFKIQ